MALNDIQDLPNPGQDSNLLTAWKNWKKIKSRFTGSYYTSNFALFSDLLTTIGSSSATIYVNSLVTLTADTTIPDNIHLVPMKGGGFTSASAYTLTISGRCADVDFQWIFGSILCVFSQPSIFRPEWWGAKADNSTDSGTALLAMAISVNSSLGGKVVLSKGIYLNNQRLFFLTGNLTIIGNGATLKKVTNPSNTNGQVYIRPQLVPDGTLTLQDVYIYDLEIDNDSPTVTDTSEYSHCLSLVGVWNFSISNCYFHDADGEGIYTQHCRYGEIHGNRIYNCGMTYFRMGISVVGGKGLEIHGNDIEDVSVGVDCEPDPSSGGTTYPTLMDCEEIKVHNNTMRNVVCGVRCYPTSTGAAASFRNIQISNNTIFKRDTIFPAIYLKKRSIGDYNNVVVSGNIVNSDDYSCFEINGVTNGSVTGNSFIYTGTAPSSWNCGSIAYSSNVTFQGNNIIGFTRGLVINGASGTPCSRVTVVGNNIQDCTIAIRLAQNYWNYITISNNVTTGCTTGLLIDGTYTSGVNTYFSISNNVFYMPNATDLAINIAASADFGVISGNRSNGVFSYPKISGSTSLRYTSISGNIFASEDSDYVDSSEAPGNYHTPVMRFDATPPTSGTSTGDRGNITRDNNFYQLCVAPDIWSRIPYLKDWSNPQLRVKSIDTSGSCSFGLFSQQGGDTYAMQELFYDDITNVSYHRFNLNGLIFQTNNSGTIATRISILTSGLTFAEAYNIVFGTTTGTKIGTGTTQKLAFWNKTPIVQPASANQAAAAAQTQDSLTDSTTGTADTTLQDVGAAFTQATLNNNFADIAAQLAKIRTDIANIKTLQDQTRTDLVNLGLQKGSA